MGYQKQFAENEDQGHLRSEPEKNGETSKVNEDGEKQGGCRQAYRSRMLEQDAWTHPGVRERLTRNEEKSRMNEDEETRNKCEIWEPVVSSDQFDSPGDPAMSSEGRIMMIPQDIHAQRRFWNVDEALV